MKISALLKGLQTALAQLAEELTPSGKVEVMEGAQDTMLALGLPPRGWRLLLHYEGLSTINENGSMAVHQIVVTIQQPKGMSLSAGKGAVEATGGRMAFFDLAMQVVSWLRAVVIYEDEEMQEPHRGLSQGRQARPALVLREVQSFGLMDTNGNAMDDRYQARAVFEMTAKVIDAAVAEVGVFVPID